MINIDDELTDDYLAESHERLAAVESDLLAMEKDGAEKREELANRIIRAMHSVKAGARFFELQKIAELAHRTEEVVGATRASGATPTADRLRVLLAATDKLRELIEEPDTSDRADTAGIMAALDRLRLDAGTSGEESGPPVSRKGSGQLRVLLVEDDFAGRLLLQTFLSPYGECHIAVNGKEAVEAFGAALEQGRPYNLVCMDIMMPEMDGREAVRRIRALEEAHGIFSTSGANIVMTTAVNEVREVFLCFKELCDAYLMKPIDLSHLLCYLKSSELVP